MRVKKLAAVTLCVALGLSTVLAGCGKTAQTTESGTAAAGQTDAGPDASAKTPETGGAAKESKAGEGKSDEKKVIGLLIPHLLGTRSLPFASRACSAWQMKREPN